MNMIELNDRELSVHVGGDNALMTWGAQAASDGLAAMDSDNEIKAGAGLLLASAGGWSYLIGSIVDLF
jgi:hypothetical protein